MQSLKPWSDKGIVVLLRLQQIVACPQLVTLLGPNYKEFDADDDREDFDETPPEKSERQQRIDVSEVNSVQS